MLFRSKDAGTVFSRNRFGAYTRKKTIPVNTNTTKQIAVRENFRLASTAWKSLTSLQRQAWNEFANNYTYTNVFGESKKLTGAQLFTSGNARLLYMGLALQDTPGTTVPVSSPAINVSEILWDGDVLAVSVNNSPWTIPVDFTLIAYGSATVPASQGYSSNKNKMRFLGIIAAAGDTVAQDDDIADQWSSVYNINYHPVGANQATWITLQMIHTPTGVVSNTLTYFATGN